MKRLKVENREKGGEKRVRKRVRNKRKREKGDKNFRKSKYEKIETKVSCIKKERTKRQ